MFMWNTKIHTPFSSMDIHLLDDIFFLFFFFLLMKHNKWCVFFLLRCHFFHSAIWTLCVKYFFFFVHSFRSSQIVPFSVINKNQAEEMKKRKTNEKKKIIGLVSYEVLWANGGWMWWVVQKALWNVRNFSYFHGITTTATNLPTCRRS